MNIDNKVLQEPIRYVSCKDATTKPMRVAMVSVVLFKFDKKYFHSIHLMAVNEYFLII